MGTNRNFTLGELVGKETSVDGFKKFLEDNKPKYTEEGVQRSTPSFTSERYAVSDPSGAVYYATTATVEPASQKKPSDTQQIFYSLNNKQVQEIYNGLLDTYFKGADGDSDRDVTKKN